MIPPTYSTREALIMMCDLDIEGLRLLGSLILEEKYLYCLADLQKMESVWHYCMASERRKLNP